MTEEPPMQLPKKANPLVRGILGLFLAGLAAVIPIIGTVWLLQKIYQLLLHVGDTITEFVVRIFHQLAGESVEGEVVVNFPGADAVRFFLPVLLLLSLGFVLKNRLGSRILNWFNRMMRRIPLLGFIYNTLSQVVEAVKGLGGSEREFKGVAYVEYPSSGCRLVGFITGSYYDSQRKAGVTTVFVPTTPSPISGFTIIIDDDKVEKSDMTVEEASKMILSAGLVTPGSLKADFSEQKVEKEA